MIEYKLKILLTKNCHQILGPFFEDTEKVVHLDKTDANYVDIIHTNGGTVLQASAGIIMSTGYKYI